MYPAAIIRLMENEGTQNKLASYIYYATPAAAQKSSKTPGQMWRKPRQRTGACRGFLDVVRPEGRLSPLLRNDDLPPSPPTHASGNAPPDPIHELHRATRRMRHLSRRMPSAAIILSKIQHPIFLASSCLHLPTSGRGTSPSMLVEAA